MSDVIGLITLLITFGLARTALEAISLAQDRL